MEQVPGWYTQPDNVWYQTTFAYWLCWLVKPCHYNESWADDEVIVPLSLKYYDYHWIGMLDNPKNKGLEITKLTSNYITTYWILNRAIFEPEFPAPTDSCAWWNDGYECNGACKAFETTVD